jgi:uncharacterized membrane protein
MASRKVNLSPNERNERLWRRSYESQGDVQSYDYSYNYDVNSSINVSETERVASGIGGGIAAAYGLSRGDWLGYGLAILGAALVNRSVTGHCKVYDAMGINTADENSYDRQDYDNN